MLGNNIYMNRKISNLTKIYNRHQKKDIYYNNVEFRLSRRNLINIKIIVAKTVIKRDCNSNNRIMCLRV